MSPQALLEFTREGLVVVLWVCLPVVLVSTAASLVLAILQAVTQIQDQSIGQSARIVVVLVTLVLAAGWMGRDVLRLGESALRAVGQMP